MVDVKLMILQHGGDNQTVLHVFGEKTTIHCVEHQTVEHLQISIFTQFKPFILQERGN